MKLLILTIAVIASLYKAEAFDETDVILDPEFSTRSAWAHQVAYHKLQDNIDSAFVEVSKIVSSELAKFTPSTIQNFSNLAKDVLNVYNPIFEIYSTLSPSDCKDRFTVTIQLAVGNSGFESANCLSNFSSQAQEEANAALNALNEFSGTYGQIVLNVYKSYVSKNAIVEGEEIEYKINSTYATISSNWSNIRPTIDQLRINLNNKLQSLVGTLSDCFKNVFDYAEIMLKVNERQAEQCIQFENNRGRARASGFKDFTAEALEITENWPKFKW